MMPRAVTHLNHSVFFRGIENAIQMSHIKCGFKQALQPHLWKIIGSVQNHGFINLTYLCFGNQHHMLGAQKYTIDLAVCGRNVDEMSEADIYEYHGKSSFLKRFTNLMRSFLLRFQAESYSKQWEDRLRHYQIPERMAASDFYKEIDQRMKDYVLAWYSSTGCSGTSSLWNAVVTQILLQGSKSLSADNQADLALILSNCQNVYSADVPAALKNLAKAIFEAGEAENFKALSTADAVDWLKTNENEEIEEEFKRFIRNHGHRCVREAELRELSWRRNPEPIVKVLQAMVASDPEKLYQQQAKDNSELDVQETISRLQTSLPRGAKFALKFIIPKARKGVALREWAKSMAVKMCDIFKEAYISLASKMVEEGRLPDTDLIYFLTHQEIGHLLQSRKAALVRKAKKRRKLFNAQMQLAFPDIMQHHAVPVSATAMQADSDEKKKKSVFELKGMPVSQGTVSGKARVVKTLSEAESIESGEVLVVPYTDVGWSPYFPLIAGLVTEIGGVISHGAVVAREYGLPCIVCCKRATDLIQTGDQVFLDGGKGLLKKLD